MKKKNFTLIELLVVVSVIIVLVGLLLPGLNSARAKAHGISCISLLKQIGFSVFQYSADNKDVLLTDYMGRPWYNGATGDFRIWTDLLRDNGYLKGGTKIQNGIYTRNTVLICPRAEVGRELTNGIATNELSTSYGLCYVTTIQSGLPNGKVRLKTIHEMAPYTSSRILFRDFKSYTTGDYGGSEAPYKTDIYDGTDHYGGKNHLFADGHAAWMSYSAIPYGTDLSAANKKKYYY